MTDDGTRRAGTVTLLRIANALSLILATGVLGLGGFVLVTGTLFFDDPNASYSDFLVAIGRPMLAATAATVLFRFAANRLARNRLGAVAVPVAMLPAILIIAGLVALFD